MTDERLCERWNTRPREGTVRCDQRAGHTGRHVAAYKPGSNIWWADGDFGDSPVAPSTDEGEARWERRHSTGGRVWWRSPEGGYVLVDESLEAAIRAPLEERAETYHAAYREALASAEQANLRAREAGERAEAAEERIRELEAWLNSSKREAVATGERFTELVDAGVAAMMQQHSARLEAVEDENERLREALRDTASNLNMASLVVDTALLPSPPSSTEGTGE